MMYNEPMKFLNVLVADDQPIFIEGMQSILNKPGQPFACAVRGVARTGTQLQDLMRQSPADLVFLDLGLGEPDGLAILPNLKKGFSATRFLVITLQDDPRLVKAAFRAGADGYMLKTSTEDELYQAIETIIEGNTYVGRGVPIAKENNGAAVKTSPDKSFAKKFGLTRREIEIMRHIGQAQNNKQIGEKLFISDQTVSVHRKNIMRKLGVNSTANLIKLAYEYNLV